MSQQILFLTYGARGVEIANQISYDLITNAGLKATGVNPDTGLVEIVELPDHPWFIGVQYHPEYKSTVLNPHPLFVGFIKAAIDHK